MNTKTTVAPLTRRKFLGRAGAALAAFSIVPARVLGANAPSKRINVAMIGTGNQGTLDLRMFLAEADVQVVAVCDVNRASHGYRSEDQFLGREPARKMVEDHYAGLQRSGVYRGCAAYNDFREVLARPDVDAVAIVVPDHWHRVMTVMAADAGKDIYCEKPLSLTVADGRAMVEAVQRNNVILQTGSHQRSNPRTRFGCELVRNGRIGKLLRIETVLGPWNKMGPAAGWQPTPVPEGFDYELWLGPAPWEPHHKDRCFYTFRFIQDYSGGQTTNLGAHALDMAQWGNGTDHTGPVEVEDDGSELPEDGLFDVVRNVKFRARYANGVELTCRTAEEGDKTGAQCRFIGTEGWVETGAGGFFTFPEKLKLERLGRDELRLGTSSNHFRDFLDCIKTRATPAAPVETGHRSASFCHLANIAMQLKRKLRWDPVAEKFVGDEAANRMLARASRGPWA